MKALLLLLFTTTCYAQVVTQMPDRYAFRGNPYQFPVIDIPLSDTATYTATLHYSRLGRALPGILQPTVTKTPGLVLVRVPRTLLLPVRTWTEVRADSITTHMGNLFTGKYATPKNLMPNQPYISLWQSLIQYNH